MKLVSALAACLVVVAARRQRKSLTAQIKAKVQGTNGLEARAAAKEAALEAYKNAQRAKELAEAGSPPGAKKIVETPEVLKMGVVTSENADLAIQQQAVHNFFSRSPSPTSPATNAAAKQSPDWQLWNLFNTFFYNEQAMIDLNNYASLDIGQAIAADFDRRTSEVSRVATALATGAPAMLYVKGKLRPVSDVNEIVKLTKLTDEYTDFMQTCEETFTAVLSKLYSIFYLNLNAARSLGPEAEFASYSDDAKTYFLETAATDMGNTVGYVQEIIEQAETMGTDADLLKKKIQGVKEDKEKERELYGKKFQSGTLNSDLVEGNRAMEALTKKKEDLENRRKHIAETIAQIEKDMDDASAELQKAIAARSDLLSNIIPEKREMSQAHWRMFYEELCSWFVEWDCKYDPTKVFQWVVDPTVIKAQYVSATEHIDKLQELNEKRQEQKIEQLRLQKENMDMAIEFAKKAGDALHDIADIETEDLNANYADIFDAGSRYLEKVSMSFGIVATEFKRWEGEVKNTLLKQNDLVAQMTKLKHVHKYGQDVAVKQHRNTMSTMIATVGDCVQKGIAAQYCAEDIAYYRDFYMMHVTTYTPDQLLSHITAKDVETATSQIEENYQRSDLLKAMERSNMLGKLPQSS